MAGRRALGGLALQAVAVLAASLQPPTQQRGPSIPQPVSSSPADVGSLFALTSSLASLEASPLALAELTDQILEHPAAEDSEPLDRLADFARRQRRSQLLTDLLKSDRAAYVETVKFLNIAHRAAKPSGRAAARL